MKTVREEIGGLGNLLFKEAFLWMLFREGTIPDIYLQTNKFWEKYEDEIRRRFSSDIGKIDKVALHVRRGDYLKAAQFHKNMWDTDYYKKAVALFPKGTKFLVFCRDNQSKAQDDDDREWCLKNIPQLGIEFEMWPHAEETGDLNAMASCTDIIGANSSFSWWAAFLNPHGGKKVFPTESQWFVDGKPRCDLLPGWSRIEL